jgi:dihydroorotate dehydrogenase (NAD+) catalytic subunit
MPKFDLHFDSPLINAAGTLGYAPDAHGAVDWTRLGAFVTNPISRLPRTPATGTRFLAYPGGFLLHTGHPNPGLSQAIRQYAPAWERSPLPVIVHLLAQNPEELAAMIERLEMVTGVRGVEVGLPADATPGFAHQMARAAFGELPAILRIPLGCSAELARAAADAGISTVSLGQPRGTLIDEDDKLVSGRLYGPAIFPQALQAVQAVSTMGLAVIGGGGVYDPFQVETMLKAGASAVQMGASLWKRGAIPGGETAS